MSDIRSLTPSGLPQPTLRTVLRIPPEIEPGDSLHRFAQVMRFEATGALPVTAGGKLLGILAQSDILGVLRTTDPEEREQALQRPVEEFMRGPIAVLRSHSTVDEACLAFAESGQTMLPVLDEQDFYLGVVCANDLLVPELPSPRPSRIGGMATPFGVYLTDGTVQAGVGNLALVWSGVMMAILMSLAYGTVLIIIELASRAAGHVLPVLPLLWDDVPVRNPWLGLASVGESLVMFMVFMLFMRMTRLAGYHAAEHQTVHAIERHETLVPGVVSRMPRPHPRCGTNLMAAVFIFFTMKQALAYVPALNGMVEFMAAAATLVVWRPVGTFLQERFTTKPADRREIDSGIAAGNDLLARYLEAAPARPSLARRIWCSGMLQVMVGSIPCLALISFLIQYSDNIRHFIFRH